MSDISFLTLSGSQLIVFEKCFHLINKIIQQPVLLLLGLKAAPNLKGNLL